MIVFTVLLILIILFVFVVKGRTGHKDIPSLRNWYYAHRGLHREGVPENSMAAFLAAKEAGYGIELDVHLLDDGKLAVIHDSSLLRTAGVDVIVEEITSADLSNYRLEGTDERIPLLTDVLTLFHGQAPLIIELKVYKNNYPELCKAVCATMADYQGLYCVESFDPRCIIWMRKNAMNVVRGQLTENFFRSNSKLPAILKFVMKNQLLNVCTRPDFIAYRFADRRTISNVIARKLWGVQGVAWTIRTQEEFDAAVSEGFIPIFENFCP